MTDSERMDQIARSGRASGLRHVLGIIEPLMKWAVLEYAAQQDGANSAADLAPIESDLARAEEFIGWAKAELEGSK